MEKRRKKEKVQVKDRKGEGIYRLKMEETRRNNLKGREERRKRRWVSQYLTVKRRAKE